MNVLEHLPDRIALLFYPKPDRAPRAQLVRCVAALASLAFVNVIDMTDTRVDACIYSFDGYGSSIAALAESFEFKADGAQAALAGDCQLSIS